MTRRVHLRYDGTDTPLAVPHGTAEEMTAAFERAYRSRFSFLMPGRPVIIEAVSAAAVAPGHAAPGKPPTPGRPHASPDRPTRPPDPGHPDPGHPDARHRRRRRARSSAAVPTGQRAAEPGRARARCSRPGRRSAVPLYRRRDLPPGQAVDGPAIIAEELATTVVEPGWRALITDRLDLLLTRVGPDPATTTRATAEADPVLLEVFGNLFMAVAEQMGERLRSTAHSVNIKERLDFSCAIFDADGGLIANAPHIPVHLGSMGESIKMVINRNQGRIRPGDVYVLNDPYHGGTHLPDVTVVTPVFPAPPVTPPIGPRGPQGPITGPWPPGPQPAARQPASERRAPTPRPPVRRPPTRRPPVRRPPAPPAEPWFYVASRGHHAEIGGMSPGSMPAASTRIEEEGVLIDNWLLVEDGRLRETETRQLLTSAEYPSRNPDTNLADLRAQVAANEKGVDELRRMVAQHGLDVIRAYMGHIQQNAAESVRATSSPGWPTASAPTSWTTGR